MEVEPFDSAARRSLCVPAYLEQCFDKIGFTAYDDTMLCDVARLAEVNVPISMQFDISPDGGIVPVFSVLSLYEHARPDCKPLFAPDGGVPRTCGIYEEMVVSDGRGRMLEQACFSAREAYLVRGNVQGWECDCLPCCTKAKWIGAKRAAAKVYLLLDSIRVKLIGRELIKISYRR